MTATKKTLREHLERPHPWLRIAFIIGGILFLIGGFSILSVAFTPIPDLNSFDARKVSESTKIYDREGKTVLYDLNHDMRRNVVPLTDMAENLQKATIAIEDDKFYEHGGVRFTSFARAVLADIEVVLGISDGYLQGGSTITQQVVKNTILTGKKSPVRKLQEWVLAWKLEGKYTKDEILEFYLNVTPYGGTLYGAEAASRAFFGKSASELSLAESAYLAALPQAPTFYSPYGNNREALDARKDRVLDRMELLGYATEAEVDEARGEIVTFSRQQGGSILAPHFVFYVEQYLEQKYGTDVVNQGLQVITTLDADLQSDAQEIVNRYALQNEARYNAENAALVAIDPKTGQILTMVGSRDYFDPNIDGNYNIALAPRQPGSIFKPFVYAAALEKGYTPETVLFDLPTQFSTACGIADTFNGEAPCYAPGNYDGNFRGPMTMTSALAQSINIPAVQALYLAGIDNVINLATRMGITGLGSPRDYGLSFALGAAEVRLVDIVSAFGVFGNDGIKNAPVTILSIKDNKGKVLEEFEERPEAAIDSGVARQISAMLSNNEARQPAYAANNPLTFPGYDVAAKTGTTNESRDAWTMGYSPTIVVGAWAGNNDNSPMVKEIAGYIVAPMWHEVMEIALAKYPKEYFNEPPATPQDVAPVLRGDTMTGHSILFWTDRNNPRGPAPFNPASDPQFNYWEYPIQQWIANGGNVGTTTSQADLLRQLQDLLEQREEMEDENN